MKYVNQGSGTDLDPNGVQLQRDTQKKKTIEKYERKAIHLEAILNTTCTKCGTAGHLSKDCFMSPDGKKYELIPEIEDEITVQTQMETSKKEKKHKQKKLKKKKKAKKLKEGTDNSDSGEKEVVKKKKKKYSKDQKKAKKKYDSSNDESSSGSFSSHDVKAHKRKHSESSEKRTKKCKHSKSKHADE
ncbi:Nucleolar protein of 40 kDa [Habropoda laboriosa]|uniref:Nucleolar protein of 40 kDa n=1 Tax=Habropoda laboriosa TaxID=597456 RepID=A0A0L7QK83_9HYME|nr:Nucleolar protein of 40 kDa [Habropoda laboriosa]